MINIQYLLSVMQPAFFHMFEPLAVSWRSVDSVPVRARALAKGVGKSGTKTRTRETTAGFKPLTSCRFIFDIIS